MDKILAMHIIYPLYLLVGCPYVLFYYFSAVSKSWKEPGVFAFFLDLLLAIFMLFCTFGVAYKVLILWGVLSGKIETPSWTVLLVLYFIFFGLGFGHVFRALYKKYSWSWADTAVTVVLFPFLIILKTLEYVLDLVWDIPFEVKWRYRKCMRRYREWRHRRKGVNHEKETSFQKS